MNSVVFIKLLKVTIFDIITVNEQCEYYKVTESNNIESCSHL